MSSDMYQQFGNNQDNSQFQNRLNSMNNIVNRFNDFRQSFNGDPNEKLNELLKSGKMSQDQYNQLSDLAMKIMGKK